MQSSMVCVCVCFRLLQTSAQSLDSAPALQQNSPSSLLHPAEQPWQAGPRDAAKHHTGTAASSSPTLPGRCQVLKLEWEELISQHTIWVFLQGNTQNFSTAGWGRCTTHLAALATLLAH